MLGAYASWNGYQYWQRNQAAQAAAMFDEVQRLSTERDLSKVERAFKDMQDRFGGTMFAQQSGFLVAKLYEEVMDYRGEVVNFASFLRVSCTRYLSQRSDQASGLRVVTRNTR